MKKFVVALTFMVLLGNARALADTQTFHAYGAAMLPEQGVSMNMALSSESAPIGAVNLSEISGEYWTGILQSVTFSTPDPTPEPASLSLLGIGVLALAGRVRRKLIP